MQQQQVQVAAQPAGVHLQQAHLLSQQVQQVQPMQQGLLPPAQLPFPLQHISTPACLPAEASPAAVGAQPGLMVPPGMLLSSQSPYLPASVAWELALRQSARAQQHSPARAVHSSTVYVAARRIVAAIGSSQPACVWVAGLQSARLSLKLAADTPDGLDANMRAELARLCSPGLAAGLHQQSLSGAIYSGCVRLVLSSLALVSPRSGQRPAAPHA